MKQFIQRILSGLLAAALLAVPAYGTENGTQFRDVSDSAYYADAVEWAVTEGVTKGTSGSTFSPGSTVTRAQAVTFLWRAAGQPEPSASAPIFTDAANQNSYYCKAVRWAAAEGITNGVTATQFQPNGTLHYDQILAFLCRAAGGNATGSDWSQKAQTWAAENGVTDGLTYAAKGNCPRSDAVYFLWQQSEGGGTELTEEEQVLPEEQEQQQQQETLQPEDLPESGQLALVGNRALAADIMDVLTGGYATVDLTDYDVNLNDARKLAESLADLQGDNPYQVERILGTMDLSGRALRLTFEYIGGASAGGASRAAMEEAEDILAQVVTDDMSDYDIAKALHDYLVLNCAYDYDNYLRGTIPAESYTAEGALLEGTAVCSGYARAYQLLLQGAGIPCEYVTGYGNGGRHGWNIIQLDGAWYHVDTTWDDPAPDRAGYVRYNYFLKSDSYLSRDHSNWSAPHACTSTKYDDADLPDVGGQTQQQQQQQQENQQKQEQFAAIRQIVDDAVADLPFRTEGSWEGMTSDELNEYRNAYVTLDNSYSNLTLQEAYQAMADDLRAQYPDLSIYYDWEHHGYRIYRKDLVAAIQKIQAEENAVRQEERDRRVAEIEAQLQDAIRARLDTCYLEGEYTFSEVGAAYHEMNEKGYTFDGYAARADYWFGGYNASHVEISYPAN